VDLLPKSIIHGDFYLDNLLFQDKKSIVIDFDQSCYFYSMYELFRVAMKVCYNENEDFNSNVDKIYELILGYNYYIKLNNSMLKDGLNLYLYMQLNDLYCLDPKDSYISNSKSYVIKRYNEVLWLIDNKEEILEKIYNMFKEEK
jgi:thiamine kinase-like enzyme